MNAPPQPSPQVIEVEDLVKEFTISHGGYGSLKNRILALARPRSWKRGQQGLERRRVLDGITLRVGRGETVGLVGRNGSGKSTLLGMLSRIYRPTAGRVSVQGRVASLLEVGTGFHPDLTGEENVYFNGAILGLSRRQIEERYDSIVAFAELEASIDAPVRNYSSGMALRLGFSVAVHMDADVILIDEALAVGDEAFQEKCFAKIGEFQHSGKTIIVVSHELDHLERVATRVVWLQDGRIVSDGDVAATLTQYREAFSH